MMTDKRVSVIITNYNGAVFIRRLLWSLKKQSFSDFEVIFVDNGSTDDTLMVLRDILKERSFKDVLVKIVPNRHNLGFCKGNNIGLKYANGEYIVFLNGDTYVSSEWMERLVKVLDTYPSIGACQSKIVFATSNIVQTVGNLADRFLSNGISPDVHKHVKSKDEGVLVDAYFYPSGTSVIYRRSILEKLDGFDEKTFYGDYDLGWRTRLLGYKIGTSLSSICYHYGSVATKKLFPKGPHLQDYKERIYVMSKNYSLSTFLRRIPVSLALWVLEACYTSLKFQVPHIIMLVRAFLEYIKNLGELVNERKKIQRIRVSSDEEIEKTMCPYPLLIYGLKEKIDSVSTMVCEGILKKISCLCTGYAYKRRGE